MRVAALYDIHGNLPALEAVLADIAAAPIDRIVVGGDVVAGPMPRETLGRLLDADLPVQFLRGNADREVAAAMTGDATAPGPERAREIVRWVAGQLPPEQGALLANWPATLRLDIEPLGEVLFCHATPRSDSEVFTRRTAAAHLLPVFAGVRAPLVVCGHTHMQFDRRIGSTRVVNAGSVGLPYGPPGAYWLALGPAVQLRRTRYDAALAAERIRRTRFPHAEAFAADYVLHPPSEADALEVFDAMAIGSTPSGPAT